MNTPGQSLEGGTAERSCQEEGYVVGNPQEEQAAEDGSQEEGTVGDSSQ